ncbi:hypothetical protein [Candidatus Uabimicrobium amorphum]|uniref:Uncharacterized protein n=1 Tax=Uabimicrobium amorphum TaxID=2596890 RepID=A0A5S9IJQ9_UABAM|nr:hypothetical protein [Candidatus Uabimicrobium amorphum]BBM82974.1 hypothetical protein UABAM_01317 [Candidatus Uabimicrobium amorphum]
MSNEQVKQSKSMVYFEGAGCFLFFITLIVGFFFLAMKTYKMYSENEQTISQKKQNENLDKEEGEKTSSRKQIEEKQGDDKVFENFVRLVQSAQTEDRVNEIVDNFSRIPLNRYDRERMIQFAESRIEELRK